jgi:hypothetical protein
MYEHITFVIQSYWHCYQVEFQFTDQTQYVMLLFDFLPMAKIRASNSTLPQLGTPTIPNT